MYVVSAKDYGLFLADEDVKKGVWLEPIRNLEYYILRNGVSYMDNWDYLQHAEKLSATRYFVYIMLLGLTGISQEAEDTTSEDAGWNSQDAAGGW